MKKITFKKFIYWLLGETAGRTIVGTWKWVWGLPVESGGKVAQKVAQESLQSMQESVFQLTERVSKVGAAHTLAKAKYYQKERELQEAERQAEIAYRQGDEGAAKSLLAKAISLEKIMPQLKQRVDKAQEISLAAKEKLKQEKEKLQVYQLDMANLKVLSELNDTMAQINDITTELDLDSARSQFTEAQNSIEERYVWETAKAELATDPNEQIQIDLDRRSLESEINNRLEKFKQ